jgi:mannose-6-phosphate isomerase-like protein (cupin superfamily)
LAAIAFALATSAFAQDPVAPASEPTYVSAADIAALIAKAESDPRAPTAVVTQPLLRLAPYRPILHRRTSTAGPDLHERQAEFFYVLRGAATLTTGGTIIRPAAAAGATAPPATVEGGADQRIAAGDFFVVPENTPHWFRAIEGELVLISMHVPRPVPAAPPPAAPPPAR